MTVITSRYEFETEVPKAIRKLFKTDEGANGFAAGFMAFTSDYDDGTEVEVVSTDTHATLSGFIPQPGRRRMPLVSTTIMVMDIGMDRFMRTMEPREYSMKEVVKRLKTMDDTIVLDNSVDDEIAEIFGEVLQGSIAQFSDRDAAENICVISIRDTPDLGFEVKIGFPEEILNNPVYNEKVGPHLGENKSIVFTIVFPYPQ